MRLLPKQKKKGDIFSTMRMGHSRKKRSKRSVKYMMVTSALASVILLGLQLNLLHQHQKEQDQASLQGPLFPGDLNRKKNALVQSLPEHQSGLRSQEPPKKSLLESRRRLNATGNTTNSRQTGDNGQHAKTEFNTTVITKVALPANTASTNRGSHSVAANSKGNVNAGIRSEDKLVRKTTKTDEKNVKQQRAFKVERSIPASPANFLNRTIPAIDPLSVDLNLLRTNYTLRSQWHGVLLDAGRHYFEIDWLYRMVDVLSALQYNALHFRLTDDQAFNVKLDSHPELAHHVGLFGNNRTYTPVELRKFVAYAKTKGITVWPEINVPGHGGGWAGIPGLIVQCPEFICNKGYGIPINVTHPRFRSILTDVLREIVDIFDNPPYLHLGGDEVDMSKPCFDEIGEKMFNYDRFEKELKLILDDIQFPEEKVIRWEMTGQRLNSPRTGKIPQHWFRVPGNGGPNLGRNKFLASAGLYFDYNEMDMAWQIYLYTRRYYHLPNDNYPIGIIVGTFELDAQFWFDRNVVGRLLAVTMGASEEVDAQNGKELNAMYHAACKEVGFEDSLCNHYGLPFISWKGYKNKWNSVWTQWKVRICSRLTISKPDQAFIGPNGHLIYPNKPRAQISRKRVVEEDSPLSQFWENFGIKREHDTIDIRSNDFEALQSEDKAAFLLNRLVPSAGIVVDLTLAQKAKSFLDHSLIKSMHALGLNLLQLRLISDESIGYTSKLIYNAKIDMETSSAPQLNSTLVSTARKYGIGVIPEISLSSNAAGLYSAGYNVPCPAYTCLKGHGVQNISEPQFVVLAHELVREVEILASSGFLHLGSDERAEATTCFQEAGVSMPDFDTFEKKLGYLLEFDGISSERVLRWSNDERQHHSGRFGDITQCRQNDCRTDERNMWFATVDLVAGGAYEIYGKTRELALKRPFAIIAEIGETDDASLKLHQIDLRMLTFTMGISELELSTRTSFGEAFIPICTAMFGNKQDCINFTKSDGGISSALDRQVAATRRLCSLRVRNITKHIYDPAFQEQPQSSVAVEKRA